MIRFAFRAVDASGKMMRGTRHGSDRGEVEACLVREGLFPLAVERDAGKRLVLVGNRAERIDALGAIATLARNGVSLGQALRTAEHSARNDRVRGALRDAHRMLTEGIDLATALDVTGFVDRTSGGIVRAGERSGRLVEALDEAVAQLEYERDALSRLRGTLTYPAILFVTGCIATVVIALVVVPRFAEVLRDANQNLPFLLRLADDAAGVVTTHPIPMAIAVGLVAGACIHFGRSRWAADAAYDRLSRVPGIAAPFRAWEIAHTLRTIATLLTAGMALGAALDHAAVAAFTVRTNRQLRNVRSRVNRGERVADALLSEELVTNECVPLLRVGEASARLPEMMLKAAAQLRRRAETQIDTTIQLVQPLLILTFGGIIVLGAGGLLRALYGIRPSM